MPTTKSAITINFIQSDLGYDPKNNLPWYYDMRYAAALKATFDSLFIPLMILLFICIAATSWSSVEHFDTAAPITTDQSTLQAAGANAVPVAPTGPDTTGIVPLAGSTNPPPGVMQSLPSAISTNNTLPIQQFPSLTGTTQSYAGTSGVTSMPTSSTSPSTAANNSLNPLLTLTPGALGLPDPSQISLPPVPGSTAAAGYTPTVSSNGTSITYPSQLQNQFPNSLAGATAGQTQYMQTMPATGYPTNSSTQMPAQFNIQSASAPYSNSVAQSLLPGLTTVSDPSQAQKRQYASVNPRLTADATKPMPPTVYDGRAAMPMALSSNMSSDSKPYADSSRQSYELQRYVPLFDQLNEVQKDLTDNVQRLRSVSDKIRSQQIPNYPLPLMEISAGY